MQQAIDVKAWIAIISLSFGFVTQLAVLAFVLGRLFQRVKHLEEGEKVLFEKSETIREVVSEVEKGVSKILGILSSRKEDKS